MLFRSRPRTCDFSVQRMSSAHHFEPMFVDYKSNQITLVEESPHDPGVVIQRTFHVEGTTSPQFYLLCF